MVGSESRVFVLPGVLFILHWRSKTLINEPNKVALRNLTDPEPLLSVALELSIPF